MSPQERARKPLAMADAAWLHMDEPTNLMVVTVACLLDEPLDLATLRGVVERRLLRFERFRSRVANASGAPAWEPDPHFTPHAHVRRVGLPGRGDDAAVLELVGDLMSTPLDPAKPLWQITLAEGYGRGCAVITRVHHCIGDGVALGYMLGSLMDETPRAEEPRPAPRKAAAPQSPIAAIGAAIENLGHAVRSSEAALNEGWAAVTHPERTLDLAGRGLGAAGKIALMSPDPRTALKGPLSVVKRAAWTAPAPLEAIKAVGRVLGGTVNDVMLTAVTGGVRRYLAGRGEPVEGLAIRAMMPVNLLPPTAKPAGGNHFGMVYVTLPVGVEDAVERSALVRRETQAIKASPEAALGLGIVSAMGAAPLDVEHAMVETLCSRATAVLTNVQGPRATLYLAGRPVPRMAFWVPKAGRLGLGLSIFSYAGAVQVGVATDAGLIPDPLALAAAIDAELAELIGLEQAVGA